MFYFEYFLIYVLLFLGVYLYALFNIFYLMILFSILWPYNTPPLNKGRLLPNSKFIYFSILDNLKCVEFKSKKLHF